MDHCVLIVYSVDQYCFTSLFETLIKSILISLKPYYIPFINNDENRLHFFYLTPPSPKKGIMF